MIVHIGHTHTEKNNNNSENQGQPPTRKRHRNIAEHLDYECTPNSDNNKHNGTHAR